MKKKLVAFLVAGMCLSGCGKQIPKDIIQPQKMENVLYDYHLAAGMSVNLKNPQKEAYRKYIFQKHGITEAEFDSSMVWYTRNSKLLAEIYTELSERFKKEEERVRMLADEKEKSDMATLAGDSVDIWQYPSIHWLSDTPLSDILRFEIKSDSNFLPKDAFEWTANYSFLSKGNAVMGLNLLFENDSVTGKTLSISRSGYQSIRLEPDSAYQLKSINGFIYLQEDSTQTPNLLINDVSLMRYHAPADSTALVTPVTP